jgi:hypothetical protein
LLNKNSLLYCETCCKLFTIAQAHRISCIKSSPSATPLYCDVNGSEYTGHSFSELLLQVARVDLGEKNFASGFCVQPVDLAMFIRHFREKYRLCWKEIYLKFSAMSKHFMPERCTKCQEHFQLNDLASCRHGGVLGFHEVGSRPANSLNAQQVESYRRQIQVIDETMSEEQMEAFTKQHEKAVGFAEPQSMNFQ